MTEPKKSFITKPLLLVALSHVMTDLSAGALPILLPFFKSAFALSYSQVGFIVLTQNFTSSIIQPLFGYLPDRLSLPWLVPAGLLLAGMGMAATGLATSSWATGFGFAAVMLASVNICGGFLVTWRMLSMFKSKKKA